MEYIASAVKKGTAGSVLFEKALIKKGNIPVLLAITCHEETSDLKSFILETGAWFQNHAVERVREKITSQGNGSEEAFESLLGEETIAAMRQKSEKREISLALCVGGRALISGEHAYLLQSSFGRVSAAAMFYPGDDEIIVREGATIVLTGSETSITEDRDKLECLFNAKDEEKLDRSVREVSEESADISMICIKAEA